MEAFKGYSLFAKNLKSFGPEIQGFEKIERINLIIGRNNSGKSALVDLVERTILSSAYPASHGHKNSATCAFTHTYFTSEDAIFFPESHSGGAINGNHRRYGNQLIGARIVTEIQNGTNVVVDTLESDLEPPLQDLQEYSRAVGSHSRRNPFKGRDFQRLAAERNIVPEADTSQERIDQNGSGATNLIQHFINKANLPSDKVEKLLLNALNEVFNPDANFSRILCQQDVNGIWEVYLDEEGKGRISLSNSGSGLKTVILTLSYIHLLPLITKRNLSETVFAFEELENNLHPALQRRLLTYIARQSREYDFMVFITTHSSIAIDLFNKEQDAQIIHVTHNGVAAECRRVTAYIDNKGILDDLDVRASDLLQANGIIWIEGPSDRVYINRWINLISDGRLAEGNHYQCVFYGGRLLSHLNAEAPEESEAALSILNVNRNAAIIMDSDRKEEASDINLTKIRIVTEFEKICAFSWVTTGREIENYVPEEVVKRWLTESVEYKPMSSKLNSFFEHLNKLQSGLGTKFERKKPLLAEQLSQLTNKEDLASRPELVAKVEQLCAQIQEWNKA